MPPCPLPVGGLNPRNGCLSHKRKVRSSRPASRAATTACSKSGETFFLFNTACREMPAAAADSRMVHPSRSLLRITVPLQSNSMGRKCPRLGFSSIAHASGRGESDNRKKGGGQLGCVTAIVRIRVRRRLYSAEAIGGHMRKASDKCRRNSHFDSQTAFSPHWVMLLSLWR